MFGQADESHQDGRGSSVEKKKSVQPVAEDSERSRFTGGFISSEKLFSPRVAPSVPGSTPSGASSSWLPETASQAGDSGRVQKDHYVVNGMPLVRSPWPTKDSAMPSPIVSRGHNSPSQSPFFGKFQSPRLRSGSGAQNSTARGIVSPKLPPKVPSLGAFASPKSVFASPKSVAGMKGASTGRSVQSCQSPGKIGLGRVLKEPTPRNEKGIQPAFGMGARSEFSAVTNESAATSSVSIDYSVSADYITETFDERKNYRIVDNRLCVLARPHNTYDNPSELPTDGNALFQYEVIFIDTGESFMVTRKQLQKYQVPSYTSIIQRSPIPMCLGYQQRPVAYKTKSCQFVAKGSRDLWSAWCTGNRVPITDLNIWGATKWPYVVTEIHPDDVGVDKVNGQKIRRPFLLLKGPQAWPMWTPIPTPGEKVEGVEHLAKKDLVDFTYLDFRPRLLLDESVARKSKALFRRYPHCERMIESTFEGFGGFTHRNQDEVLYTYVDRDQKSKGRVYVRSAARFKGDLEAVHEKNDKKRSVEALAWKAKNVKPKKWELERKRASDNWVKIPDRQRYSGASGPGRGSMLSMRSSTESIVLAPTTPRKPAKKRKRIASSKKKTASKKKKLGKKVGKGQKRNSRKPASRKKVAKKKKKKVAKKKKSATKKRNSKKKSIRRRKK